VLVDGGGQQQEVHQLLSSPAASLLQQQAAYLQHMQRITRSNWAGMQLQECAPSEYVVPEPMARKCGGQGSMHAFLHAGYTYYS
jgi:hypothetical protein